MLTVFDFRQIAAALVLALLLLVPGSANAEDGVLNGVAFDDVPRGAAFEVRAYDDSDDTRVLEEDFAKALTASGYTTAENAPLILSFETRDEIGAGADDGRHVLSFQSTVGQRDGERARAEVNVYNSTSGGLLNKGQGGTSVTTPSSYRLDVTIEDRQSGKTLWQGWAVAQVGGGDGRDMTRRMVPKLIGALGKTVRQEPISLY